jgi:DNA-binding NarL/FixJ family response regulator
VPAGSGSPASPAEGHTLSPEDFARIAAEVLSASPFPSLVLEVPSERIVASSPSAAKLLAPAGGAIVGQLLEQFTADRPSHGVDVFAGGRLNGFETFRILRRAHGTDLKVRMWIRNFDSQPSSRFVLVVIVADPLVSDHGSGTEWREAPAVVGTTDARLLVERISSDAESLFNRPMAELLDASLIALIADHDVAHCLAALSEAFASQSGITVYLDIKTGVPDSVMRCEVLILPLQPSPSCAFVFLPIPGGPTTTHVSTDLSAILLRLGRGAAVAQLARGVFLGITEATMPGLNRLTTREMEIVTQLMEGSRVPAIAGKLVLSQSTVRNHLASVFAKLGVTSQQGLTDLMRQAQTVGPR